MSGSLALTGDSDGPEGEAAPSLVVNALRECTSR